MRYCVLGESWAIFDQATVPSESIQEKQTVQSEEGISPWSSDSKEFGNGSPPDWKNKDSGSGTEQWSKRRRDQEGWWDTSAEPEGMSKIRIKIKNYPLCIFLFL